MAGGGELIPIGGGGQVTSSSGQESRQATQQQAATSFIPAYSQTPILESIARYAQNMAPQVYQWGMDQYARNQGNIDALTRQAQTWASPQRIASEMGMAEAGVTQAGEAARQASIADLQSYGIDPSAGRYASLDQASRVQTAAAAAGAGTQQRMATQAAGNAMLNQAIQSNLANTQVGYGASGALNQLLGTGMQLKYAPLGTQSTGTSQSTGQSTNMSQSHPGGQNYVMGGTFSTGGGGMAKGGYVSPDLSPTDGADVDDVPAQLNAGEYVIPKDVVGWKGKSFFAKLIAQSRKERAMNGSSDAHRGKQATGYQQGGLVDQPTFADVGADYDMPAARAAGLQPDARGHLPDTYKLPNHPTFSSQSRYSADPGTPGWQGGERGGTWSRLPGQGAEGGEPWMFTPGPSNLQRFTPDEMHSYFQKYEPD